MSSNLSPQKSNHESNLPVLPISVVNIRILVFKLLFALLVWPAQVRHKISNLMMMSVKLNHTANTEYYVQSTI